MYEPKDIAGEWESIKSAPNTIIQKAQNVALLENRLVFDGKKELPVKLQENFRLLGQSSGYILSTNIDGVLRFQKDDNTTKELQLKKTIATAATDGDVVAVVFASGDLALYGLDSQELLLKIDSASSIALDSRVVAPHFMDDLVLFFTLDGKVVIVNKKLRKKLRTIIISSSEYFNNDIYFSILKNQLIIATASKILSFGQEQKRVEYEARVITHDKNYLYVATKQGDIIKLTPTLEFVAKAHFPFAHFLGLAIKNNKVYALEKEGYLIALDEELLGYKIYEADIDTDSIIFSADGKFFVDGEVVILDDSAKSQ